MTRRQRIWLFVIVNPPQADGVPFEYRSGKQVLAEMDEEDKESWIETVDPRMTYQFAMALWKNNREEEARRVLSSIPPYLYEYLDMDQMDLIRKRMELYTSLGCQFGTVDMLVGFITIPYALQKDFREWIRAQNLHPDKDPSSEDKN